MKTETRDQDQNLEVLRLLGYSDKNALEMAQIAARASSIKMVYPAVPSYKKKISIANLI